MYIDTDIVNIEALEHIYSFAKCNNISFELAFIWFATLGVSTDKCCLKNGSSSLMQHIFDKAMCE